MSIKHSLVLINWRNIGNDFKGLIDLIKVTKMCHNVQFIIMK